MAGNPLIARYPFYKLVWSDLRGNMPFASDMQLWEASQRLTEILNETFTREARKMAYEYEQHDRQEVQIPSSYDVRQADRADDQDREPA